jgi:tripartite-type tricarboxylate transporter receptor subunit TctC
MDREGARRRGLLIGGAALAMASLARGALAFPSRPIRILVPQAAGGVTDVAARLAAAHVQSLGQPCVAEARAGAAGSIAALAVARAAPDGHTLLMGTTSTHGTNPFTQAGLPYDPVADFEPVVNVGLVPSVITVRADHPARSLPELIEMARARPAGQAMTYGSAGAGGSIHLSVEILRARAGIALVHVPYRGSGAQLTDLIAGHIDFTMTAASSAMALIEAGRVRALAVTSLEPTALAPGVPTVASFGMPGYATASWNGLFAPKGTPEEAMEAINRAFNAGIATPEGRSAFFRVGVDATGGTRDDLRRHVQRELATWSQAARDAGVVPEKLDAP